MTVHYATRDRTRIGGWAVPVGSVLKDEYRACDHCGNDVNVLTVRTVTGPVVVEDDHRDRADEDQTLCARCVQDLGPNE